MANVIFRRGTTSELANISITDGAILFNTETYKIYVDNGTSRIQFGGDTDLVTSISEASSTNTFSGSAIVNLFLQKTSCINSASTALAVTQDNIPLGCKAFAEEIGNYDFSGVGASVSAALVNLSNYVSATLATGETTLTFTNSAFGSTTGFRVQTDTWGINPTDVSLSGTTLTLTFDAQEADVVVRVFYSNIT